MKRLTFPPNTDLASLLLRLFVGGMFLLHGVGKVFVVGMDTVAASFTANQFPVWTAHVANVVEIAAGLALVLGIYSRLAVLALLPITVGILIFHFPNGWVFSNSGGGWEYPQLLLVALLAIFFLGTGRYGLTKNL